MNVCVLKMLVFVQAIVIFEIFCLQPVLKPSKKKWLASFFQKFCGREGGFFFDLEVLMLLKNKIKHIPIYCHHCIQVFRHTISYINIILECRKLVSFRTTKSDFYQVLQPQNSIEIFLKKNYENKKKLSRMLFQWLNIMVGQGC